MADKVIMLVGSKRFLFEVQIEVVPPVTELAPK